MRSFFETTRKRCNSNNANSTFEQATGELRATLLGNHSGISNGEPTGVEGAGGAGGPGRASRRGAEGTGGQAAVPVGGGRAWPGFEPTRRETAAAQDPLVWRAPEGPEDAREPGCGARGRQRHHRQPNFARNLTRSFFETTRKRCNSNDMNSKLELIAGELRATLLGNHSGISNGEPTGVEGAGGSGGPGRASRRGAEGTGGQAAVPVGGGRARADNEPTVRTTRQHTRPHWCGGRRRVRRARAGFEARRRTK